MTSSLRTQLLLERLRAKSTKFKNFNELSKKTRSGLLERRFSVDPVEKGILQKALDALQEKIPVRSAHGMAERLETIGRKIGLKFMAAPVHGCFYLETEMFYVEINIDSSGNVKEAKIHHIDATKGNQHSNTQNCPEIIDCLSKGDFSTFIRHLEELVAVYNLSQATAPEKSKAWIALTSVEKDLEAVYTTYRHTSNAVSLLYQSPLGVVYPRTGGLPMRLRYFASPTDFLDNNTSTVLPISIDAMTEKDLGYVATVTVEKSESPCLLPMTSLMTSQGLAESKLNGNNSFSLPVRFVLKLREAIPLALEKCQEILDLTNMSFYDEDMAEPLLQLIVKNKSKGQLSAAHNRGLFVTLPDQQHCYFMTDSEELTGVMVSSIPFAHPSNVETILSILRQQVTFNTVIESCVRPSGIQDLEKAMMFEVTSLGLGNINVTFEHPLEEFMITLDFDLSDITRIQCQLYTSGNKSEPFCKEKTAAVFMQKSLSIPVTLRTLVRKCLGQAKMNMKPEPPDINISLIPNGAGMLDGNGKFNPTKAQVEIKSEPMDFETSSDSLNANGPRDPAFHPEAQKSPFNLLRTSQKPPSSIKPEFMLTKSSQPPFEKMKKEPKKELSSPIVDIKPSVSITPVSSALTTTSPALSGSSLKKAGGIEIIPLGGGSGDASSASGSSTKTGARDIRRSLSEDDKRRLEKKSSSSSKKRKHDSSFSSRDSSMPSKKLFSPSSSTSGLKTSSSSPGSSLSKTKLASVIDKLAQSSSETGIEITPTNPLLMPKPKDKIKSSPSASPSSNLKMTIKSSSKHGSPKPKDGSGKSSSSSSSFKHGHKLGSGSSHGRHSSSGNGSKIKSISGDKERKKLHSSLPSFSKAGVSSTGASTLQQRQEEVKKLLDAGKLNKTFQIPKLSKTSSSPSGSGAKADPSPSRPTTSPKYSISPKQSYSSSGHPSSSPKYIGGGTVTPPNISPKHPYSAPSSVLGMSRSSPHHHPSASPKAGGVRTPSASPRASSYGSDAPRGDPTDDLGSSK